MVKQSHLKLAVEALEKMKHTFAIDRNLANYYAADYPRAKKALEMYSKIQEAIDAFKEECERKKS